jgi:riboflavin biosynthesis pyrimidine reductase
VSGEAFADYCRRRAAAAVAARLPRYITTFDASPRHGFIPLGNDWTKTLFDGPFYVREPSGTLPATNLVFVQSRDGNTGADDPGTLGGGDTDKHLVYEGLSRVLADAVLSGASTARGDETVLSIWHPELVALRLAHGQPRHPAQVVVTRSGNLPFDSGLMFTTPDLRAFVIAPSRTARTVRQRVAERPWIDVIDAGDELSLTRAMQELATRGMRIVSAIGGRRTAGALIDEGLVSDLYLTTAPRSGGEPQTPFYHGPPLPLDRLVEKVGTGEEAGVRFEHFAFEQVHRVHL